MKKFRLSKLLLLTFSLIFCSACGKDPVTAPVIVENGNNEGSNTENPPKDDNNNPVEDPTDPPVVEEIYDETEDSLEGVDATDITSLITAANKITTTYKSDYRHFFNDAANDYYRINYGSLLENGSYTYESSNLNDFNLVKFNEEYITAHPFTKVSKNKYQNTEKDVVLDFIKAILPTYQNEGFYMTFKRVTIELDDNASISRIRIYCNTTQIGKLIESHKDTSKSNWYLLFIESNINKA